MASDERVSLVLTFARTLFVNGQATDQMLAAAERLARAVGLGGSITARWGELQFETDSKDHAVLTQVAADPAGIDMDRVASTMRTIEDVKSGRMRLDAAI